jgi:hypothetical protein
MTKTGYYYLGILLSVSFLIMGFSENRDYDLSSVWNLADDKVYEVPTYDEVLANQVTIPQTGKTFAGFKQSLAFKESQGKYRKISSLGYLGKYQFGMKTLATVGVYDSLHFIQNPQLQEKAFKALMARNKWELRKEIENYTGKEIAGVRITESGLLAAAHLGGVGSVKLFLKTGGSRKKTDAFGTSVRKYIRMFEGYDVSCIQPNPNAQAKHFQ